MDNMEKENAGNNRNERNADNTGRQELHRGK